MTQPSLEADESSIEPDQIAVGSITRSLVITLIGLVACVLFVTTFFPRRPGATTRRPGLHLPEPRLQLDPSDDLRRLREREARRLHGYGWVDPNAGAVHIPIERAQQLLLLEHAEPRP
jgi:hypothetical protein